MTASTASWLDQSVRTFAPGYPALVMATGIISVGLELRGHATASRGMMVLGIAALCVHALVLAWRVVRHRDALAADLRNPGVAFGFFTVIAAMNVTGVRLAMAGHLAWTAALLAASGALWLVAGYVIPWTAVLGPRPRPGLESANGTWFTWVVGSQSVAVAAAALEPHYHGLRDVLAVVAVVSWSVGVFLYGSAGVFVALRLMLYDLRPADLTPPYWVSMGAAAITVLAGARIVEMADAPMVAATRALIAGIAVVFWAFATWLIPVLVAAGWWRHVRHRQPLAYEPTLWSMIFPLGMYAVAGIYLGEADHLPLVGAVGAVELWVALGAWMITFGAMLRHLAIAWVAHRRGAPA